MTNIIASTATKILCTNNNKNKNNGIYSIPTEWLITVSAGIQVISASDIGQAANTGEIPLLFLKSAVGSLKSLILGW